MRRADSLLAPLIRNLGIEDAVRLERIREEWQNIFERPISFHTSPSSLREGELLISVDSPVWLQQLGFYKEAIIKKLHGFGVKTVRFKLGRVLPERKYDRTVSKSRPLTESDSLYIEETITSVADQELRERIKRAIEKSITFKR
ncbi:MAG: DUF721 domain-containing protein [Nitrospirae bacterium]|nr:DUF721 domain-containing protein [Nitrospirota bacterium]